MLGRTNQSNSTLIVLKPVSKLKTGEKVKPFFQISKKNGNAWEVSEDQSISQVSGNLVKVEAEEEEYNGEKYFRVKLFLKDSDEMYLIPFRLNIATRSLLNSIFSLTSFDNVTISYYESKSGYDVYSVFQDRSRVSWKYELDELPKPQEVTFKGKTIRDFTDLDAFYIEKLNEFSANLNKSTSSTNKAEVEESVEEETVEF